MPQQRIDKKVQGSEDPRQTAFILCKSFSKVVRRLSTIIEGWITDNHTLK